MEAAREATERAPPGLARSVVMAEAPVRTYDPVNADLLIVDPLTA